MKAASHPVITIAESEENASASVLNQNSFFRVVFSVFPVSLLIGMHNRLLKYSLQREYETVSFTATFLLIWINLSPAITALWTPLSIK